MKLNLSQILENTILLEGRLEDVKAKYDESYSNIIDQLSGADPSGNNKYLDWMTKQTVNNDQPMDAVITSVIEFDKALDRLKK